MDESELLQLEARAWRKIVGNPYELMHLIAICHYLRTEECYDDMVWYEGSEQILTTACARAAQYIVRAMDKHDRALLFNAVANLSVSIGIAFQGGDITAFVITRLLLGGGGYKINSDNEDIRDRFISGVLTKRPTELVNLFDGGWSDGQ